MNIDPKGADLLKTAVVARACNDWLKAAEDLRIARPGSIVYFRALSMQYNCEEFFFSQRFALYTEIDPNELIDRLEWMASQGFYNLKHNYNGAM